MTNQPYQLTIERIEPDKDMARFYALSIETTLFGEVSLTRTWGRIGSRGRQKIHAFETEPEAVALFLALLQQAPPRIPAEITAPSAAGRFH